MDFIKTPLNVFLSILVHKRHENLKGATLSNAIISGCKSCKNNRLHQQNVQRLSKNNKYSMALVQNISNANLSLQLYSQVVLKTCSFFTCESLHKVNKIYLMHIILSGRVRSNSIIEMFTTRQPAHGLCNNKKFTWSTTSMHPCMQGLTG